MKDEVMTTNAEVLEEEICCLENELMHSHRINPNLYIEYDVKRGLRDSNGNGVLTGLTEISDVIGTKSEHGRKVPVDGQLFYQGYNVEEIVDDLGDKRFGFEEVTYLLLFGKLPTPEQRQNLFVFLQTWRSFQEHLSEM